MAEQEAAENKTSFRVVASSFHFPPLRVCFSPRKKASLDHMRPRRNARAPTRLDLGGDDQALAKVSAYIHNIYGVS